MYRSYNDTRLWRLVSITSQEKIQTIDGKHLFLQFISNIEYSIISRISILSSNIRWVALLGSRAKEKKVSPLPHRGTKVFFGTCATLGHNFNVQISYHHELRSGLQERRDAIDENYIVSCTSYCVQDVSRVTLVLGLLLSLAPGSGL